MKCQQQQIVVYNSTIKTELKRGDWVGISIHEKKKKKVYLKPLVRCYYSSVTKSEKKKKEDSTCLVSCFNTHHSKVVKYIVLLQ
mmetsp:Transcript_16529/g.25026  ORF Transcript_16529/g.25026 Transcript_16529/m.25026 type:complete len:84 (+) Transcript_16529:429-680(+)